MSTMSKKKTAWYTSSWKVVPLPVQFEKRVFHEVHLEIHTEHILLFPSISLNPDRKFGLFE